MNASIENRRREMVFQQLERLRLETGSGFAAVAGKTGPDAGVQWLWYTGNRDQRVAAMKVNPGSGLAGVALRTGTPCHYFALAPAFKREFLCPLMLAEQLTDAIAIPNQEIQAQPGWAAALIGRRAGIYDRQELGAAIALVYSLLAY